MALRIACDLDGTLADMDSALRRETEHIFGDEVSFAALTDREKRRVWTRVREIENFWVTLSEIEPGTVARLGALASFHGWQVLFLTQRPDTAGETAQVQSQRWLEAHGFELPSVYVMNGSRGKVAAALGLDCVLDDRPENCLDVVTDSKARALLVWREESKSVPRAAARHRIEVVSTTAAALDILQKISERSQPGGLIGRFRAAVGI